MDCMLSGAQLVIRSDAVFVLGLIGVGIGEDGLVIEQIKAPTAEAAPLRDENSFSPGLGDLDFVR